ncbi:tyrosyl-DNA phosphodiesterase-domain-containing protein [Hyaloraphidium curvatum]|nr:tyrosyl-DNA phosphodiesterase-domain-containing protein [Hyaloraphidium curvatum]
MAQNGFDEQELEEAIRLSLADGPRPGGKRKRSVVVISDSEEEEAPPPKRETLSQKAGSFLADRAAMERDRLARLQSSTAAPSANPEPSRTSARSSSETSKPAPSAKGRFRGPGIYYTYCRPFPVTDLTVTLDELLDVANLKRAFISSFDWEVEFLFEILGDKAARTMPLWLGMPQPPAGKHGAGLFPLPGLANAQVIVPRMEGWGAMHTKLMVLDFGSYARVVVPSSNFCRRDWQDVENVCFVQQFPLLGAAGADQGLPAVPVEGPGNSTARAAWHPTFGEALLDFLEGMGAPPNMLDWVRRFDYATEAEFIGSRPVTSTSPVEAQRHKYGLNRLCAVAKKLGLGSDDAVQIEYATSSLGSLKVDWLQDFGRGAIGLPARAGPFSHGTDPDIDFAFLFPSLETVRSSLHGVHGPGTVTLSWDRKYWDAEPRLRNFIRTYESTRRGLISHGKIMRVEILKESLEIGDLVGFLYAGSHNFTLSAWGRRTKDGLRQCMNWETGVVVPVRAAARQTLGGEVAFRPDLPTPYQRPAPKYKTSDVPFFRMEELQIG